MNILLVTMSMQIGGAETHVLELAKGLKRRGYKVFVMSNGGEYVKELEENKIEHIHAPIHNKNLSNMIESYKILKQVMNEKKIDIVHAHARIPAMIAHYACKKMHTPMVTTAHGVYKVNPILKALTKWGEKTIAVSEDVKDYLIKEYGVDENNISVTVNGIDMNKFKKDVDYSKILKEFTIDEGMKKIVHVSRLDDQTVRVPNILIDIAEEIKNAQFIIVGSGTKYQDLKERAETINNRLGYQKIVMTGGRTDINRFDSLADIFIGVSRAALEAMSAEKNVILAGNQGYGGIFSKDTLDSSLETNFCFRGMELPDENSIKSDIEKLFKLSPNDMAMAGKYNREIVEKYYSIDKMIDDADKMYRSI